MKTERKFIITTHRDGRNPFKSQTHTLSEMIEAFSYTLECGASYAHEKGNKKINRNPRDIKSLIKNLNNAVNNSAANGYAGKYFTAEEVMADGTLTAIEA